MKSPDALLIRKKLSHQGLFAFEQELRLIDGRSLANVLTCRKQGYHWHLHDR